MMKSTDIDTFKYIDIVLDNLVVFMYNIIIEQGES